MKKPQLSKEEGQSLVAHWKSSGKSITQYCKEEQVPTFRLHYWKRVFDQAIAKPRESKFVSIKVESNIQKEIEIQTPGGYLIRLTGSHSLLEVLQLLN